MIDIETYRVRIGMHSPNKQFKNKNCIDNLKLFEVLNSQIPIKECLVYIIYLLFIIYSATVSMSIVLSTAISSLNCCYNYDYIRPLSYAFNHPAGMVINTKNFYLILVYYIARKYFLLSSQGTPWNIFANFYSNVSCPSEKSLNKSKAGGSSNFKQYEFIVYYVSNIMNFFHNTAIAVSYWMLFLNFILIAIVNPSLLNPGPANTLSVAYQNVQGLIPFGQLNEDNPLLDVTKMIELNLFVNEHKPDVLVLN